MSSSDEVPVSGAAFGLEGGERASVCPASPGARGPGLDLDLGAPRSSQGEGALAHPEGFDDEQKVIEVGGAVLWGREGRPDTDPMWEEPDYESLLADESAAIVPPLSDWAVRGVGRHPSSEGWDAEVSALWRDLGARLSVRGPLTTSAAPPTSIVPRKVRARRKPKTGAKSTLSDGGRDPQRPLMEGLVEVPSDPQSPDEFREVPMRVSIYPKGQVQGEPSSPEEPGDTPRHSSLLLREKKLPMQGTLLTSPPWGLVSGVERQAVGELDSSSSKKMQGVVWGKAGNRPGFPGAAAAAVGSLPRAVPRKKVAQEKKCPVAVSNLALGRPFPPWGQRLSAVLLKPVTLPPIAGVGLLGRSESYSWVPSGPKHSKHSSTGKKSRSRKAKDFKPAARDDNVPNRDPRPKAHLPSPRPGQTCLHMHHGEFCSDDPNTRAPQAPGTSQATALSQGGVTPRGPAPSSDQEPPVHAPRPERQQQPPGAQGCVRCALLRRDRDQLKERLG